MWHRASFLHSVAMCPDSLQFQQTVAEVHSAAKWLLKQKKKGAQLQFSLNKYSYLMDEIWHLAIRKIILSTIIR